MRERAKLGRVTVGLSESAKMVGYYSSISILPYIKLLTEELKACKSSPPWRMHVIILPPVPRVCVVLSDCLVAMGSQRKPIRTSVNCV